MIELVVELPLLALFRRRGWLSFFAFLTGGCAAAVAFYFAMRGTQLPEQCDVTQYFSWCRDASAPLCSVTSEAG